MCERRECLYGFLKILKKEFRCQNMCIYNRKTFRVTGTKILSHEYCLIHLDESKKNFVYV